MEENVSEWLSRESLDEVTSVLRAELQERESIPRKEKTQRPFFSLFTYVHAHA